MAPVFWRVCPKEPDSEIMPLLPRIPVCQADGWMSQTICGGMTEWQCTALSLRFMCRSFLVAWQISADKIPPRRPPVNLSIHHGSQRANDSSSNALSSPIHPTSNFCTNKSNSVSPTRLISRSESPVPPPTQNQLEIRNDQLYTRWTSCFRCRSSSLQVC
jgi:hypothetical protein